MTQKQYRYDPTADVTTNTGSVHTFKSGIQTNQG